MPSNKKGSSFGFRFAMIGKTIEQDIDQSRKSTRMSFLSVQRTIGTRT